MTYVNTGDFVESCSLVVEHFDGRFEVHALAGRAEDARARGQPRRSRTSSNEVEAEAAYMRILIATDAWRPQVNGVVSTLERMTQAAAEFGAEFEFLTPQGMWTAPMPTYPDIRLALTTPSRISRRIEEAAPDHIHIATEGPIGWLTRALLPEGRADLHHELSHALSRIHLRAHRHSRAADLRGPAPFPRALRGA